MKGLVVSVTKIFSVRYIYVWMQVLVCGCRYEYVCMYVILHAHLWAYN